MDNPWFPCPCCETGWQNYVTLPKLKSPSHHETWFSILHPKYPEISFRIFHRNSLQVSAKPKSPATMDFQRFSINLYKVSRGPYHQPPINFACTGSTTLTASCNLGYEPANWMCFVVFKSFTFCFFAPGWEIQSIDPKKTANHLFILLVTWTARASE